MIFRSLTGKFWLFIVSWVFLILLIFGGILAKSTHDFYYGYAAEENEELTDAAKSMANYLSTLSDLQLAQEHFVFLGNLLKFDLLATDLKGNVILGTHQLRNWQNSAMSSEDMLILRKGQSISFEGNTPYSNQRLLKVATPIKKGSQVVGAVFVLEPLNYLEAVGRSVTLSIEWGLVASFILALPFALFFARKMAHPVVEMDEIIKDIATGNYSRPLPVSKTDELASLGQSFNTLSEEIRLKLQEITRERQQLANILASIEDGVLSVTPTKKIFMANRVALNQFNLPAERSFPQYESNRIPNHLTLGDLPGDLRSFLEQSLTKPVPHQGEFKHMDQIFRVETSPLLTDQECSGLVAVWHNITKERELENLRREFVADVTHELRTPLSYLQGYSEALLDGVISDENQKRRYLETILTETLRLRRLVNDLLDLNRIEFGGSLELPHEAVSVSKVIQFVQEQLSPAAQKKQVSLLIETEENLPSINCGTDRLQQIILNLTDNALRFSPKGGQIFIRAYQVQDSVEISVKDQGPGIALSDQVLIWNRFERGSLRQNIHSGTGLGLAIVKSLVDAYDGEISLLSEPNQGATFIIRLPLYMNI